MKGRGGEHRLVAVWSITQNFKRTRQGGLSKNSSGEKMGPKVGIPRGIKQILSTKTTNRKVVQGDLR